MSDYAPSRRLTVDVRISEPWEKIIRVAHINEHLETLTEMIFANPGKSEKYSRRRILIRTLLGYQEEVEEKRGYVQPLELPDYVKKAAARNRPVTSAAAMSGYLVTYALRPLQAVARTVFEYFRKECDAGDMYITVKGGVGCGIALIHELLRRGELTNDRLLQIHAEFLSSDLDTAVMIRPTLPARVFDHLHNAVFGRTHKVMFDFRNDQLCIGGDLGERIMADVTPHFVKSGFASLHAKERGFRRSDSLNLSFIAYTLSRDVRFQTALGFANFLLMRFVFPATTPIGIGKGELFDLAIPRRADSFLQGDFGRLYHGSIDGSRIFAITSLIEKALNQR